MGKFLKNIAVVCLWLAGTIIIAHAIIPHDHRPECSGFGNESSCNEGTAKAGHHHPLPLHCHSFNDLTCEKFTFIFEGKHNDFSCFLFTPVNCDSSATGIITRQIKFFQIHEPLIRSDFSGIDPLRAPPALI